MASTRVLHSPVPHIPAYPETPRPGARMPVHVGDKVCDVDVDKVRMGEKGTTLDVEAPHEVGQHRAQPA